MVEGRRGHVHQQHREGHAVGIAAPRAQRVDEHADTGAEDEPAARCRGRRDGIGGDEERAQHGAAGEKVEQGRRVAAAVDTVEHRGDEDEGGEE